VVGGVAAAAHHAGKRSAEAQANEQAQQQEYAQPQYAPPPPAPPAPAAPSAGGSDMVTELTNLKSLLDSGVLTQAEFDAQKQKVLNGQ